MKNINYRTNDQLWSIENTASAAGYKKTSDCYWAQIFTNAAGDEFSTSREEDSTNDPAADLDEILNPSPKKYAETRTMSADSLRSLCIEQGWYTRGTCKQYERLFDRLYDESGCPIHLTAEKLAEIAEDIMEHSNITDYSITTIMFALADRCHTYFGEV